MNNGFDIIDLFNNFFLIYGSILFFLYIFIALLSTLELRKHLSKNINTEYKTMLALERLPSVSIIAPAYNEEQTIVDNIRCLLSIYYPMLEIIIVNDGSKDNSMQKIIDHFHLNKVNLAVDNAIQTKAIKGVYKSSNPSYSNLIVIDKENGGKGDALNAGINTCRSRLFLGVDVDCIIEPDAILRMVKPFLEEENESTVIASGGVIRVANSCEIDDGKITKVNYPDNFWARFQVLEYFRAFTLGRMAWSRINGLLIISGAFGLFDRALVSKVGGYDTTTVGEDLELVVRMRRYMHEIEKKKYKVAFIPDPLCWTEVPETYQIMSRQRNRWTRGAIDTIKKHRNLFFNPKYGLMGMVSFPYWVFFEWLAPMFEAIGLIYFLTLGIFGLINIYFFLYILLFVFLFSFLFSLYSIYIEAYTFARYTGGNYLRKVVWYAILEMFIYHPCNVLFSIQGNIDFFFAKNKHSWGNMTRTGFSQKKKQ